MDPVELRASLCVLLAVAQVDGDVDHDERHLLSGIGSQLNVRVRPDERVDLPASLAALRSDEARELTFRAAVAMANVDGRCSPQEHSLLMRIRAELALPDAVPLEVMEEEWAHRMQETRARIDRISDKFLDEMAARETVLSQEAYERMVADLERKKDALLRDAVSSSE